MSFDMPENESCVEVNPPLWEIFLEAYRDKYRFPPSAVMWTEENVIQWFDRQNKIEEQDYA